MAGEKLRVDYLIKGAGAVGMAFADTVFHESEATMAIVDRRDCPGGHWNDAYPFVRLHQPSATYGVNSLPLGSGSLDKVGLNQGFQELASGHEVVGHFDQLMRQRFLPSGRVHFFPMSEVDDGGKVMSRLSGAQVDIEAGILVDATYSNMSIPATTTPPFSVAEQSVCVPVNDLPRRAAEFRDFVVVGAGKTGMDACVWLLQNGVDPDRIRWIMPRDSWVLNRANVQASETHFAALCKSLADQVQAVAEADSAAGIFTRLEEMGELQRIDPDVEPEAYHCAILSEDEIAELRRIPNIIRMGHVVSIGGDEIQLDGGTIPTSAECLHIDCSATGIPGRDPVPVFNGDRITLQWVRTCQPTFSSAFVGHVECTFGDPGVKNRLCPPISPPTTPQDWARMLQIELATRATWQEFPELGDWLAECRLDPFAKFARTRLGTDEEALAQIQRYLEYIGPAADKLHELMSE
ncbi:MAG: NAD(P)/FAD-dependent oxidoreductase [Acidimicrobiales bacterium]